MTAPTPSVSPETPTPTGPPGCDHDCYRNGESCFHPEKCAYQSAASPRTCPHDQYTAVGRIGDSWCMRCGEARPGSLAASPVGAERESRAGAEAPSGVDREGASLRSANQPQEPEPVIQPTAGDHAFTRNPAFVDRSNPSRLTERLYLAGAATAREHDRLRALGITAVVNLTPDDYGCHEAGFKVYRVRIDDAAPLPVKLIAPFLAQMDEWEASGETVLIHCHAGISRTSAFAIAWLMHKRGANPQSDLRTLWSQCEDAVGAVRPIIMPHYLLKRAILSHFGMEDVSRVG